MSLNKIHTQLEYRDWKRPGFIVNFFAFDVGRKRQRSTIQMGASYSGLTIYDSSRNSQDSKNSLHLEFSAKTRNMFAQNVYFCMDGAPCIGNKTHLQHIAVVGIRRLTSLWQAPYGRNSIWIGCYLNSCQAQHRFSHGEVFVLTHKLSDRCTWWGSGLFWLRSPSRSRLKEQQPAFHRAWWTASPYFTFQDLFLQSKSRYKAKCLKDGAKQF